LVSEASQEAYEASEEAREAPKKRS